MKEKIHYVIEAALAIAVLILFVLFFWGKPNTSKMKVADSDEKSATEIISLAYIDVESLMSNYTFFIDLNEQMAKEYKSESDRFAAQFNKFQKEVEEYKRLAETGSFFSRERQIASEQRLAMRQEELQKLEAKISQDFQEKQIRLTEIVRQTIYSQIQDYNNDKGYHFIFGKMNDNILLANESKDITAEVIDYLNKHYTPSLKEKIK